ncbi:MAG: lytic murein transglycosylase [Alphaproteobacteria bacterium]|nr:lytic murein transglycosylase [Alphaproteobacteria bacterium]
MASKNTFLTLFSTTCIIGKIFFTSPELFAQEPQIQINVQAFENWKEEFKKEALQKGVEKSLLNRVLPDLKLLDNVLKSDRKQSEFLLTFWDYTNRTLSESRIKKGREILLKYQAFLDSVSKMYGVDKHYLVAFWGLETNYGLFKGKIKTLDALATLSFDKRRRRFFTNELITLLKIMQNGEETEFYGSWAGAFGNFQFMPTTYAAYAVDADGDGNKDIINSLPDAFSSAANYLSKMGWDETHPWGREVTLFKNVNWNKITAQPKRPVKEWIKLGVKPLQKISSSEREVEARLVMPMGINGPKFLTYPNYDKIMRWNNSSLYALSVGLLANMLKEEDFQIKAKKVQTKISRNDIEFIQSKLISTGHYKGKVDGVLGFNTKQGIRAYQKARKLPQDGYPSNKLIQKLKREK